ncbi:beta-phosphoglucomutase [Neobacillus sp. YIM B06451]|uniref:beta-phosphoglucomutase n=1 Tax=Neobacillus sp. YIM B06451 TaxID=3070994 RepID=UPI00292CAFDF|nr:beta-phosphoglucomutase [Neobacillus sp. YIM B06451]
MKRKLQAVIFDMDGVIVDTYELYYIANKKLASMLELPFTRKDNDKFRGISRMDIVEALVNQSGKTIATSEKLALAEEKNRHYKELLNGLNEEAVMPGIKRLIDELREHNIKIAIASSSTNSETVLKKIGLFKKFDYIVDAAKLKKGKPDPEIFLKAADYLKVPAENCAAIEDGAAGVQAIKKTTMFSVGIGHTVIDEKPDWYVDSTSEITFQELVKRFEGEQYGESK